jgi:hypothetical protein
MDYGLHSSWGEVIRWRPVALVMTYAELEDTHELETKCTRLDPAVCTSLMAMALRRRKRVQLPAANNVAKDDVPDHLSTLPKSNVSLVRGSLMNVSVATFCSISLQNGYSFPQRIAWLIA